MRNISLLLLTSACLLSMSEELSCAARRQTALPATLPVQNQTSRGPIVEKLPTSNTLLVEPKIENSISSSPQMRATRGASASALTQGSYGIVPVNTVSVKQPEYQQNYSAPQPIAQPAQNVQEPVKQNLQEPVKQNVPKYGQYDAMYTNQGYGAYSQAIQEPMKNQVPMQYGQDLMRMNQIYAQTPEMYNSQANMPQMHQMDYYGNNQYAGSPYLAPENGYGYNGYMPNKANSNLPITFNTNGISKVSVQRHVEDFVRNGVSNGSVKAKDLLPVVYQMVGQSATKDVTKLGKSQNISTFSFVDPQGAPRQVNVYLKGGQAKLLSDDAVNTIKSAQESMVLNSSGKKKLIQKLTSGDLSLTQAYGSALSFAQQCSASAKKMAVNELVQKGMPEAQANSLVETQITQTKGKLASYVNNMTTTVVQGISKSIQDNPNTATATVAQKVIKLYPQVKAYLPKGIQDMISSLASKKPKLSNETK